MRRLLGIFGSERLRVELQRPLARHDRVLNRGLAALAARLGVATVATGNVHAHTPERAYLQDAFVAIREHTTLDASEPLRRGNHAHVLTTPQAMAARFADHPEAVAETERLAETLTFDLTQRPRLPLSGSRGRRREPRPGRDLPGALRRALSARQPAPRGGEGAPGGGAAGHRRARARGLLRPAPRDPRARARDRRAGARARAGGAGAAAARARAGLERLVDRLPSHGPQPRRPDREQAPARALPQRGADGAARHRPRLPARHPRGADPAHPRHLRSRALGARRGVPDLPRARRDPRAGQGARAGAGRDRARRARQRGVVVARGRPRHRQRARRGAADGALGVAGAARRRGLRPAAPSLPALRRDDRRDAAARGLRPARPGGDGGPPARPVGQGLLLGRGLSEDRPARAGDAERRRALRRAHRGAPRRADRPVADPVRRSRDVRVHPERRHDRRLSDRVAGADGVAAAHAPEEPRRDHDPGRDRAAGADRRRRGQPVHRAPPGPARRPELPGALPAPVARAAAARHARDDHLPGPGARGRAGVRRLQRRGGRGAAPGDEPQALGGRDRGAPSPLRRGGDGASTRT